MALSNRELDQLNKLVSKHGYADVVAALSTLAMREAYKLEDASLDPRRHAAAIGEYAWIAELLGQCSDALARVS